MERNNLSPQRTQRTRRSDRINRMHRIHLKNSLRFVDSSVSANSAVSAVH